MSFFDALVYTLAYFPVISALACIDNPLPMPTTVHELRGQSYMRHRPSYLTRDTLVGSGFWGGFFVGIPWCWGCAGTLRGR